MRSTLTAPTQVKDRDTQDYLRTLVRDLELALTQLNNDVSNIPASTGTPSTPGESFTPISLAYATTLNTVGDARKTLRCILTGNTTIAAPTSPVDGARLTFWLTASGADRTVNLNAAIKIPSSSVLTFPVTITSGKKARLTLEYDGTLNGGQWEVVTYVMGY